MRFNMTVALLTTFASTIEERRPQLHEELDAEIDALKKHLTEPVENGAPAVPSSPRLSQADRNSLRAPAPDSRYGGRAGFTLKPKQLAKVHGAIMDERSPLTLDQRQILSFKYPVDGSPALLSRDVIKRMGKGDASTISRDIRRALASLGIKVPVQKRINNARPF